MKRTQAVSEKQYVKAWLKLLTEVANAPRQVDEYFFGGIKTIGGFTDESEN